MRAWKLLRGAAAVTQATRATKRATTTAATSLRWRRRPVRGADFPPRPSESGRRRQQRTISEESPRMGSSECPGEVEASSELVTKDRRGPKEERSSKWLRRRQ